MANSRAPHLAAEVRAARRHRNLTQAALAAKSGVSAGTIHQIEREKITAKPGQLVALAEALDTPAATFLCLDGGAAS